MIDDRDQDYIDSKLLAREYRFSRKERVCDSCGEAIHIGDQYVHEFGLVDGRPLTVNRHSSYGCPGY